MGSVELRDGRTPWRCRQHLSRATGEGWTRNMGQSQAVGSGMRQAPRRSAVPNWYKAARVLRTKAQSAAARVAGFRPTKFN